MRLLERSFSDDLSFVARSFEVGLLVDEPRVLSLRRALLLFELRLLERSVVLRVSPLEEERAGVALLRLPEEAGVALLRLLFDGVERTLFLLSTSLFTS